MYLFGDLNQEQISNAFKSAYMNDFYTESSNFEVKED